MAEHRRRRKKQRYSPNIFGKQLKRIRHRVGMSRDVLASTSRISAKRITEFETGYATAWPAVTTLLAFARALNCSCDELLGHEIASEFHTGDFRIVALTKDTMTLRSEDELRDD